MASRQKKMEGRQVKAKRGRQCTSEGRLEGEGKEKAADLTAVFRLLSLRTKDTDTQGYDCQAPLPSVTEAEKEQLQQYLEAGYCDVNLDIRVVPSCKGLPVSEIFVPIILIKDMKTLGLEKVMAINKPDELRSYKELFFKERVLQKKIFLLGRAGAGKSTFCRHLTDIWCNDKVSPLFDDPEVLKQFCYLFHVSCRFPEASESILDMIYNQLFSENDEIIKVARHVLKNTPDECLVLVDGIDEWIGSASKATGGRGDMPCLPSETGLEDCIVFATFRPEKIHIVPTSPNETCCVFELHGIKEVEKVIEFLFETVGYVNSHQSSSEFLSQVEQLLFK